MPKELDSPLSLLLLTIILPVSQLLSLKIFISLWAIKKDKMSLFNCILIKIRASFILFSHASHNSNDNNNNNNNKKEYCAKALRYNVAIRNVLIARGLT